MFKSATITITVLNETFSINQTVDTLLAVTPIKDIEEIIFLVCDRTLKESLKICYDYQNAHPNLFKILFQQKPFLGGAIQDGFDAAKGSHVLIMSSDLETDPKLVPVFIQKAKENPSAIITANRWMKGGSFEGYNPLKWALNFVFQKFFALFYGVKLSDMTYGYRIFPKDLVQKIRWQELKHPFFLETLLKPLRLGVRVIEVPCQWTARVEGKSQNPFINNFLYFRIGLKVRFYHPGEILK